MPGNDLALACLSKDELHGLQRQFRGLLQQTVAGGASVGFVAPVGNETADAYWQSVGAGISTNRIRLIGALQNGVLLGAGQLRLEDSQNGEHRAEIVKILVHPQARRRGIARLLMAQLEQLAKDGGKSLLILDTKQGDVAEGMYEMMGYQRAGVIPDYARDGHGVLGATVIFYKTL